MATGDCPCGAEVKPAYSAVDYVTQALLDLVIDTATKRLKFGPLIQALLGITVDNASLCSLPRPDQPRAFTLVDFALSFPVGMALAQEWLYYRLWELVCQCVDCPPVSNCGVGGTQVVIDQTAGYVSDPTEPRIVDYFMPSGDLYVARYDGYCLGPKTGLHVTWYLEYAGQGQYGVRVCNYNETGCDNYSGGAGVTPLTLTIGEGSSPVSTPWPVPPDGVANYPAPPTCDDSDVCLALSNLYTATQRIEYLTGLVAGAVFNITSEVVGTLPGMAGAITGTALSVLPRLIAALAPPTPAQLTSPADTPITQTTSIPISQTAYVQVKPEVVPSYIGSRGSAGSEVYYSNHRTPGPGWLVCHGQEGVLWHRELLYPSGIEFAVPSMATDLDLWLSPGVTVTVTTWQRGV